MSASYENLVALLRQRRSCRAFSPEPVESAVLDSLREAFSLAPQAGGGRHLACSFITDREQIRDAANAGAAAFAHLCENLPSPFIRDELTRYGTNFVWFHNAPALAVITCREEPAYLKEAMGDKAPLVWGGGLSGAMAAFALLLAAESLGLGACCLTGPLIVWREMETRLAVSKRESLVLLVALGHKIA